jgi:hypothetical protein
MGKSKTVSIDSIENDRVRHSIEEKCAEIRDMLNNQTKKITIQKRRIYDQEDKWYYYAYYHVPKDYEHEQVPEGQVGTVSEHIISVETES